MKNLEQVRAAAALPAVVTLGLKRSAISKLPGLILNNGLLAAAAFCNAEGGGGNRPQLKNAMGAIASHLAEREIVGNQVHDIPRMILDLSARDAIALQRATQEALAFLAYLKRFATND